MQHPFELEVGAYGALVDVVGRRLVASRVVRPVPRLHGPVDAVVAQQLLDPDPLGLQVAHRRHGHLVEHAEHGLAGPGGLVLDHERRVVVVPEQGCALGPQRGDPGQRGAGVVLRAAGAAVGGGLVQPATYVPVAQGGQRGLDRGQDQADQVSLEPGGTGCRGGRLDRVRGKPLELGGVGQVQGALVALRDHPVAELRGQGGDLDVDPPQPVTVGLGESRTGADEVSVVALGDALLLRRQAVVALPVDDVDAREELRVEQHRVPVLGDQRVDLGLQRLHLGRRHRRTEVAEHPQHSRQRASRHLERLDGVGERRLGPVRDDRSDLAPLFLDPGVQGGAVVRVVDRVEGRERERQRAGREERVGPQPRVGRPRVGRPRVGRARVGRPRFGREGRAGALGHGPCSTRRVGASAGPHPAESARLQVPTPPSRRVCRSPPRRVGASAGPVTSRRAGSAGSRPADAPGRRVLDQPTRRVVRGRRRRRSRAVPLRAAAPCRGRQRAARASWSAARCGRPSRRPVVRRPRCRPARRCPAPAADR